MGGDWQSIDSAPTDGSGFIAIGNEEMAVVWWEPEAGMRWKIWNIPGAAVRLGDRLDVPFHSWCRVSDLHKSINVELNPHYYGLADKQ